MQFAIGVSLKHFGRCRSHGTGSVWDSCCKIAWVLKNSFQGISITKFVRKLLNVRSPQTLEFAEITALVPFSTPTRLYTHDPVLSANACCRQFTADFPCFTPLVTEESCLHQVQSVSNHS